MTFKRAGTTVAKDLDAAEMGTISEGDGVLSEVSFYTNGDFQIYAVARTWPTPERSVLLS